MSTDKQRAEGQAALLGQAAFALVGAVLGALLGVAFEVLRILVGGTSGISLVVVGIFCVLGALIGGLSQRAVVSGVEGLASFYVGLLSAFAPEHWVGRDRSPVDWPRWLRWCFILGVALGIVLFIFLALVRVRARI